MNMKLTVLGYDVM